MYNGKNFIVDPMGLEIFYKDLPSDKSCTQYNSFWLAHKGDGWRLPTFNELSYMYSLHNLGVLNFVGDYYWSSSDSISPMIKEDHKYAKSFTNGHVFLDHIRYGTRSYARPVRTISL
jgi:hypothetical protein